MWNKIRPGRNTDDSTLEKLVFNTLPDTEWDSETKTKEEPGSLDKLWWTVSNGRWQRPENTGEEKVEGQGHEFIKGHFFDGKASWSNPEVSAPGATYPSNHYKKQTDEALELTLTRETKDCKLERAFQMVIEAVAKSKEDGNIKESEMGYRANFTRYGQNCFPRDVLPW